MRRILMVLTVALVMAAMLAATASVAFAASPFPDKQTGQHSFKGSAQMCGPDTTVKKCPQA